MLTEPNPTLLRPIQNDEFVPPISLWTTLGGLFLVGTVGVAVMLAAVVKYNTIVKAAATVRPAGELRIVQAATEGMVTRILVKENQVVKQGDAIAYLDNSRLQIQKNQLQGNIQYNQRQLIQITAQLKAVDSKRLAESSLMNRSIAAAKANLSHSQRDYRDRQIVTQTEVQEAEASLELAREEMKRYQQLGNTGAITTLQIKEKEQAFQAAQARMTRAKTTLNPSNALVAIANEQIAQERAKGLASLATLDKEREELLQRQVEIRNELHRNIQELQQIGIEVHKTLILAPASGTILKLNLRNPSQVVKSGETITQIAPSNTSLVVMARVAAQDISKVRDCKEEKISDCKYGKAQLRFSAYPYPDYGVLQGTVTAISPDVITPPIGATSVAAPYYEVTIQPERPYLLRGDRSYPIQPGMEVTANIISNQETILTFILRKARLLTDL
ncbi:hemolysin D [Nostoc minutum NIES-26]|uniref:Hemolysin D n=1 Tax=Nostoc minutum NIES-26 TaxID=1844469 RepID=A0A367QQQ3_9NOSO|nr:hemolysin D [Nostoc minutum NIES-26]